MEGGYQQMATRCGGGYRDCLLHFYRCILYLFCHLPDENRQEDEYGKWLVCMDPYTQRFSHAYDCQKTLVVVHPDVYSDCEHHNQYYRLDGSS